MKRLIALTLVIVMVLGVSVTGYAASNWKQGEGLPPGIQKKVTLSMFTNLRDLDLVPWAKNAMEKMCAKGLIKGYGDNTFKPKASVSQLEVVVMALRVLGWEQDARSSRYAENLVPKYKGGRLDPWAYGYVNVAYEKGILDEVDIMYFNPSSAAKRWEVAKCFVRALGKEDIAEDHMKDKLDFKDYTAIPVGAVGYIYVMNDLGLMVGNPNGTFNPNGAVSRAEMAVLLERIDGKVDRDTDGDEIYGRVVDVRNRQITIKSGTEALTFSVKSDADIRLNGKDAELKDIRTGDSVRLKASDNYYTFSIDDDTLVYIDGKRAETDDLMADMPVVVRYEGDTALKIMAESLET